MNTLNSKLNTQHATLPKHSAGRVVGVCAALALCHSLLAARPVKRAVCGLLGRYSGLYRLAFALKSLALTGWGAWWFLRQPDRTLYRVHAPWSWGLRAVQAGALAMLLRAVGVVGWGRFLGLSQAAALARGTPPPPTPEAQGPALRPDGTLDARGPFAWTRHPDNLPIFGVVWFFPHMTVNKLALALLLSLYAVLGSLHEDSRLRAAYGRAFERYARRVPFLLPLGRTTLADEQEA
ncbi:MAG TPA: hypothetical protein VFS21_18430 [Roseiflexaceae bacterium]|nr:hypothetical protein [Roseiflexaceae bacterium]